MTTPPATFLALPLAEAERQVVARGGRPFHARVVRREAFRRGVLDYGAMTSLPRALRERLAAELPLLSGRVARRSTAPDGATKLLVAFPGRGGREDLVETVHIPPRDEHSPAGATLCVSTQVGCPVGCPFCASGLSGLVRNLEAHEIVEQYALGRSIGPLGRSVVMGIGEPLLNAAALQEALAVVHDELGLGARKVTVSTVGFPERVRRAAEADPRFQLAISLHTPFDAERDALVPAMAGVPVEDVLAAGDHWFERTGREVTYEVVLLAGANDDERHADELARRLAGRRATVNLIPYNPVGEAPYGRPTRAAVDAFQARLRARGLVATVRWSRGVEADAACGQLRVRSADAAAGPAS